MKYFELDASEKNTLKKYENDKYKSVKGVSKKVMEYKKVALHSLHKTKNINIRISQQDLQKIKSKAIERGLPYQTLISSIIHQYSRGKVRESI
jgi:predicted DNA binding CopG/RHH family protein